jgi:ligand-binding SRPBCC domain-containing protein
MRYRLYREQHLNCAIDEAWNFFSRPENLAEITPKEMNFTVTSLEEKRPIFKGMRIHYSVSPLFSIPLKWETEIRDVLPYRSFTDFQVKGPYSYWNHTHEFVPTENGVIMKDTVSYELPLGLLGQVVHRLLVKSKLKHIFDYRGQVLENKFNKA